MTRRLVVLLFLPLVLPACQDVREIGPRYRAERDLWKADREISRQRIRPDLISEGDRQRTIERYEAIVSRYGGIPARTDSSDGAVASRELRAIVARALLSAAYLQGEMGDSAGMLDKYDRLEREYADQETVWGEVAWARGQLAEARKDWSGAAAVYQQIVDRVEPDPLDPGVRGAVLGLPVKIVTLRTLAAGEGVDTRPFLEQADRYYRSVAASKAGTLAEVDARWFLADVARELKDWNTAINELQVVEKKVRQSFTPARDPARARFATLSVFLQKGALPDTVRQVGRSISEDYPDSPFAPRALLSVAACLAQFSRTEESLRLLDEIEEDYSNQVDVAAAAMQTRGQILERAGRWPEALTAYQMLQVNYPLSAAALDAPLEIATHYDRIGAASSRDEALEEAEQAYRSFIGRYPEGEYTAVARERLVQTLAARADREELVTAMVDLGEALIKYPRGAGYLVDASRLAVEELRDTTLALRILDRLASEYSGKDLGQWAVRQADHLRGSHGS